MNIKSRIIFSEKGAALIISILILTLLTVIATISITKSVVEMKIARNIKSSKEAFYIAEAGTQRGLRQINDTVARSSIYYNDSNNLGTIFPSQSLGNGTYSVTVASSGTDSYGNKILSLTSTGAIPLSGSSKQIKIQIIPQYTNSSLYKYAAFGINGVTFNGQGLVDSYNSALGTYGGSNIGTNGDIGTNGTANGIIGTGSNTTIKGDAAVGNGGNPVTVIAGSGTITGTKSALPNNEVFPSVSIPSPAPSPGTALSLKDDSTKTLSAGTYYYTSISISGNGKLNITGNVTIYVSGAVSIGGKGIATTTDPTKFQLKVSGTSNVAISGNGKLYGAVYAPNANVTLNGGGEGEEKEEESSGNFFGAIVGKTVTFNGGTAIHYDEALARLGGENVLSSYKISAWHEIN